MAQITLNSSGVASSGSLLLQTNGTTTQATVDTSGNLGLGVTPSAWQSGFRAVQLSGLASWNVDGSTAGSGVYFGNNVYRDATDSRWEYIASGDNATQYLQASGQHIWRTSASGTAGNAITFTQAMTLDASGNLGVGTTSPAFGAGSGLEIERSGTATLRLERTSSAAAVVELKADSGAGVLETRDATPLIFGTSATERARIDSSGNLLVGTTSAFSSGKVCVQVANGSTQNGITIQDNGTSGFAYIGFSNGSGSTIGSVSRVGTTSAVVYNTTSDARLKSNIEDAAPVLNKLMQVQVRQYDWTEGDLHQDYGFIAQELEPLLSGVVTKGKTEEDFWQLDYARLTPHLVKAIQELNAKFEAYKAAHP